MGDGTNLDVEIVVVGAGLAGLTAATVAARRGSSVAVLDLRSVGGRARSDQRDGFVLNQGPHALYRAGRGAEVLARLGVRYHGATPFPVAAGYRATTGDLGRLPTSASSLLRSPLVGLADKVRLGRLLAGLSKLDAAAVASVSAAEWIASLGLSADGVAVLSALARVATYAGDLELVSADAAVGQLRLAATGNVLYLDGGWQTLVDGLAAAASTAGVRLLEGERVLEVRAGAPGRWEVTTATRKVRAASVVVAAGGPAAARALLPDAPDWELGPPATAACLDLGLRTPPPTKVAYGLDAPLYFSTHGPRANLAPNGGAVVHVMRYGARTSAEDRADLWTFARACGVREDQVVVRRFLHAMLVCPALPGPGRGLAGRPGPTATGTPGLFLAGDWVGPEGLLADAALASGEVAGQAAAERSRGDRTPLGAMVER